MLGWLPTQLIIVGQAIDITQRESSIIVTAHELFLAISPNVDERRHSYRELFSARLNDDEIKEIRKAAGFSMPLGDDRFKSDVETMLGRTIGQSYRGRPQIGALV